MTLDVHSAPSAERKPMTESTAESVSRRSLFQRTALWSTPRKISVASAAVFAGIAARGATTASAHAGQGQFICCNLARPDQWCAPASGTPPYWCDHGGFKRYWYCCGPGGMVGCGECQSGTGTCHDGPPFYCSYGWTTTTGC